MSEIKCPCCDALLAKVRELEAKVVEAVSPPRSTNTVFADWILDELHELFDPGDVDGTRIGPGTSEETIEREVKSYVERDEDIVSKHHGSEHLRGSGY